MFFTPANKSHHGVNSTFFTPDRPRDWFEQLIASDDLGVVAFRTIGTAFKAGCAGFVILGCDTSGEPVNYWHQDNGWSTIGDETSAEYPKLFANPKTLRQALKRIRDGISRSEDPLTCEDRFAKYEGHVIPRAEIALWVHDDISAEPLMRYMLMQGAQFPGNPRQ